MQHSKVSVVIPMYNAEGTIIRTIDSVLKQSYKVFEILIVNDGSTDNSKNIVEEYIKKNSYISVELKLFDQKNSGVSKARNFGMKASRGDYIALLDSDDEWDSTKIERQIFILETNPDIDFLGANRNHEKIERFYFKRFKKLTRISSRILLYKTFFVTPTVIFKRKIIDKKYNV